MANNPKKLTDPTDEAMTAIQQVLSASDEPHRTPAPAQTGAAATPPREPARRSTSTHPSPRPRRTCSTSPAHVAADDVRPGQFAANDDRQSIGQILQTLQQRPSKTSYVVATVFARRLGGVRRGARLPLSARSAGGAEARLRPAFRP